MYYYLRYFPPISEPMYVITGEMIIKSLHNITVNAASLENHIIYKQFLVVRKNTKKHKIFIKSDAIQNIDNNKLSHIFNLCQPP